MRAVVRLLVEVPQALHCTEHVSWGLTVRERATDRVHAELRDVPRGVADLFPSLTSAIVDHDRDAVKIDRPVALLGGEFQGVGQDFGHLFGQTDRSAPAWDCGVLAEEHPRTQRSAEDRVDLPDQRAVLTDVDQDALALLHAQDRAHVRPDHLLGHGAGSMHSTQVVMCTDQWTVQVRDHRGAAQWTEQRRSAQQFAYRPRIPHRDDQDLAIWIGAADNPPEVGDQYGSPVLVEEVVAHLCCIVRVVLACASQSGDPFVNQVEGLDLFYGVFTGRELIPGDLGIASAVHFKLSPELVGRSTISPSLRVRLGLAVVSLTSQSSYSSNRERFIQ